ncbi:MAG: single-stranded DNA-binding protein [Opitutales bacterium]|nr:single-stranded DNA-binding protein [Opitutales bacterium]
MASFNKVILAGNLTRDPEKRVTPSGLTIVKLGLAVNRRFQTQSGEQKEEVTFVDIDAFGKPADIIAQYCQKGKGLLIEGRLRLDSWQDKTTGENRSKLGVVLENFQFLDSAGSGGGSGGSGGENRYESSSPPSRSAPPSAAPKRSAESNFPDDEDVPF